MTLPEYSIFTTSPLSNLPMTSLTPTARRLTLPFMSFSAAPLSTMSAPFAWASLIQRDFFLSFSPARNIVPISSPETAFTIASGSELDAIIMLHPASLQISAAFSFVLMPPVPTLEVGSPAICSTDETSVTVWTILASGCIFGFLSYNPSTSERIIRRSASILLQTYADNVSLSPNTASISLMQTTSFSLMIGTTSYCNSVWIAFLRLRYFSRSE